MGTPPPRPPPPSSTASSSTKKVVFSRYELGRLLGCGAFAKVYHARDATTGQSVAVKCISKHKVLGSGLSSNVTREISIMRRLRHPNIVRSFEVLASRDRVYFVMELAKGGELFSRLASRGRLPEDLARLYFRQLVSAVGYCHSRGVFHRDLKPDNLLLDDEGNLKVTDFGLSGVVSNNNSNNPAVFHTLCGTPAYVAPEILAKKGYEGAKVDVWSCGVILFVLVAGYLPFNDPNLMAMYRKIYRGEYRCPNWVSPDLKHLISRLLDVNPRRRIIVDEILHDPWFKTGLEEGELASIGRFRHVEDDELVKGSMEGEDRELNAFDLISFSSGFDLSGLFEEEGGRRRERLVARGTAEGILGILEKEVGKGEGMEVRRKGMGLVVKAGNGCTVAVVEVYRLNRETAVVEVAEGGSGWEALWRRMRPTLEGLAAGDRVSPLDRVGPAT